MSAKQSKIFNFFQRKPSLDATNSPSVSRANSFNEDNPSRPNSNINAAGDAVSIEKGQSSFATNSSNMSSQKKRNLGETKLKDCFQEDFPDLDALDTMCDQAEGCTKQDSVNESQESRPPKKKRKRIVSTRFINVPR